MGFSRQEYWSGVPLQEKKEVHQRGAGFLDSLVDYDGYSISSKGFLPTVVDIMVI